MNNCEPAMGTVLHTCFIIIIMFYVTGHSNLSGRNASKKKKEVVARKI